MMDSADLFNTVYNPDCSKITIQFLAPIRINYNGKFIDDLSYFRFWELGNIAMWGKKLFTGPVKYKIVENGI